MDLLLGIALVLGVMILVHEIGHFLAARLFKVRVDVFSIGFGPRLFGWKRGDTDYRVSALPLGGYVRMAGQDPSEIDSAKSTAIPGNARDEKTYATSPQVQALVKGPQAAVREGTGELMSKPRWQRALISFAGPLVNLIFPIFLLVGLYVFKGEAYPPYLESPVNVVAFPPNITPPANSVQVGDKLISIAGVNNPTWEQAEQALNAAAPGTELPVEVENNGARRRFSLRVPERDADQYVKAFGYAPIPPVIDDLASSSPAERAGLAVGDRVVSVNGGEIQWWGQFVSHVRNGNGAPVKLKVERKGQVRELTVTPEKMALPSGETAYLIGVGPIEKFRPMGFRQAVTVAVQKTGETVEETVGIVGKLFSGRVSLRQLQGPVGISRAAGQAAKKGPLAIITLMVLISVNLGILNLLPIPILDGGHILLLAIEGVLRRDMSMAFKERFVQVGLVFLLVVFAIVMYNDVVRLLPIHS
jgi:regulator of sigma E protease